MIMKLRVLLHNLRYLSGTRVDSSIQATRDHVQAVYKYASDEEYKALVDVRKQQGRTGIGS